jgi:hypothetical protein
MLVVAAPTQAQTSFPACCLQIQALFVFLGWLLLLLLLQLLAGCLALSKKLCLGAATGC